MTRTTRADWLDFKVKTAPCSLCQSKRPCVEVPELAIANLDVHTDVKMIESLRLCETCLLLLAAMFPKAEVTSP